jgi:2-polyprenyl-3-methyl-5-hydroxy-6-metoxy-1,4-benzoquinol methylase
VDVIAIDISNTMLALARAERTQPHVSYLREAIGHETFDLIVSSLALHHVANYLGLAHNVAHWLTPRSSTPNRRRIFWL